MAVIWMRTVRPSKPSAGILSLVGFFILLSLPGLEEPAGEPQVDNLPHRHALFYYTHPFPKLSHGPPFSEGGGFVGPAALICVIVQCVLHSLEYGSGNRRASEMHSLKYCLVSLP